MNTNQQLQKIDPETGEITTGAMSVDQSLAATLSRTELDQQVATARALPRHIKQVLNNISTLATMDEETSAECVYVLPRGGKKIRGPSIRMAEIIASQWGNCRMGARVVHVDKFEKVLEAEGIFHDLETNAYTTKLVRRRISDKRGRLYNDDMITMTGNAACSVALRNAILSGVPKAVWRAPYTAAESVLSGNQKPLGEVRDQAIKAFAAMGVDETQVCARLELESPEEITRDHVVTLRSLHAEIKRGERTADAEFSDKPAAGEDKNRNKENPKGLTAKMDELADSTPKESSQKEIKNDVDPDEIDRAYHAGVSASRKGMKRESIPKKFGSDKALSTAWLDGFDTETNSDNEGEE